MEIPWANHNHHAPAGQFRVISFDRFKGFADEELVGDFISLDEAIEAAKGESDPWYAVYVYSDSGACVWSHSGPAISGGERRND